MISFICTKVSINNQEKGAKITTTLDKLAGNRVDSASSGPQAETPPDRQDS